MPRLRRAVVAGAWLAVASFALAAPLRVAADDTPVPPETVPSTGVIATTADTTSVATTTEAAPTTTPAPTESTTATTTAETTTTTAAATTTTTAATTTAASTTTSSTAPPAVTEAEQPARAPLPAVQSKRQVAPVTATAKPPRTAVSQPKTTAALRPALAAGLPELVTGVVKLRLPGVPTHLPLRVTPPLEGGPYVFPVTGEPVWGDTYGAPRSQVAGGWHHGDDIFAMLGTPVVAVADGTLNRVGWDRLGGWGLWLVDRAGDEFYYAHLSGYSKLALLSTQVSAGEVIGFIGNTGDAFTTIPHLHFEVHPRGLLQLGYDGAVDPTTYLRSWRHVRTVVVGRPFHPPFPIDVAWRAEALQNFRQLLDARGLDRPRHHRGAHAPQLTSEGAARLAGALVGAPPVAAAAVEGRRNQLWLWALPGALLLAVALLGALAWRRRRRTGSVAAG
jgi:murein DD-endopeptidase MepM/ murein hydrolase activator NlpD